MQMDRDKQEKIEFQGTIQSVQPRSTVWRYKTDNRTHKLTGYNLFLAGTAAGEEKAFSIAISEKQLQKYRFHIGDEIKGSAWTKLYAKLEAADYYRVSNLKKLQAAEPVRTREPFIGDLYDLTVYDRRGCRMLSEARWKGKCFPCKWACKASVTIEYNFGVSQRYRYETFCYGPEDCSLYAMGRKRGVPYIGTSGIFDEGWIDEICLQYRYDEGYTEEEDE